MHGVGGQAPRTEGRPEYKTEAAEEVIGGQEQETPDDMDFFFGNQSRFQISEPGHATTAADSDRFSWG
jgi:hypothetical protein